MSGFDLDKLRFDERGLIPAIMSAIAALGILFLYKLDDKRAAEYAKANVEREAAEKAKQA